MPDILMLLLPLLALVALGQAQSFSTPPATGAVHDYSEDPIYSIGDKLDIQWDVPWTTISLYLWQNDNPNAEVLLSQVKNTGKLSWQIKTDKDYSDQSGTNGTVFFFQVVGSGKQVGSHYFNLTRPLTSSSSSPSAAPSSTSNNLAAVGSGSSSDPPTSTSAALSSSPTPTPDPTTVQVTGGAAATAAAGQSSSFSAPASPSHDNTGLAAGLGVAFGLVFAGLVGAIIYIFIRRRRNQRSAQQHKEVAEWQGAAVGSAKSMPPAPIYPGANGYYSTAGGGEKGPIAQAPIEMASSMGHAMRVHEMPGMGQVEAGPGNVRHISEVYEMPVGHVRNGSTGMYSEEGG